MIKGRSLLLGSGFLPPLLNSASFRSRYSSKANLIIYFFDHLPLLGWLFLILTNFHVQAVPEGPAFDECVAQGPDQDQGHQKREGDKKTDQGRVSAHRCADYYSATDRVYANIGFAKPGILSYSGS